MVRARARRLRRCAPGSPTTDGNSSPTYSALTTSDRRATQDPARILVTGYTLRHSFATGLVRAGYDLVLVASLLGHARTDTVRIYTLPTETDVATAVENSTVDY
jgi:integrase/recombinase XerC